MCSSTECDRRRACVAWLALALAGATWAGESPAPPPAGLAAPAMAAPAAAPGDPCTEPLCYTASSLEAERNHIVLHDLNLTDTTHGLVRIQADRAEAAGLDLGSSRWVLSGHVQVFMQQGAAQQGQLHADQATVQFANKHIASMTASGAPAEFERSGEKGERARGHARTITYDLERGELQLDGESWLSDGCNEINSPHILYDILRQRVQAGVAGDATPVRGTIRTRAGTQCASEGARP